MGGADMTTKEQYGEGGLTEFQRLGSIDHEWARRAELQAPRTLPESDIENPCPRKPGHPIPRPTRPLSSLSEEEREQAVSYYVEHGNLRKVAARLGITNADALALSRSAWWQEHLAELDAAEQAKLHARYSRVLHKSLSHLETRLDEGDTVIVDGEERRIPIPARTLAAISASALDKRDQLKKGARPLGEDEARRLLDLADALRGLPAGKPPTDPAPIVPDTLERIDAPTLPDTEAASE